MMSQYLAIKEQYRDAVLFFRLGDFYEMFNEDALEVSRLLNLTLTHRVGNPMCGIPYHASRVYIARLLRAGKKIAICEQMSLPQSGKGIAERKVVEVITPGTVVEEDYLDKTRANYLCAIHVDSQKADSTVSLASIDISTGEFIATSFPFSSGAEQLRKELGRLAPREILLQQSLSSYPSLVSVLSEYPDIVQNRFPDWSFNSETAYKRLCALFGTESLSAFSLDVHSPELYSAGFLLEYLSRTSGSALRHVCAIEVYTDSQYLSIDDSSLKNLEIVKNLRDGNESYTLLEVMNHTKTAMGNRLLRKWLLSALLSPQAINQRLDRVDLLYHSQRSLSKIRTQLSLVLDLERLSSRVAMDRCHPKDLAAIRQSLSSYVSLLDVIQDEGVSTIVEYSFREAVIPLVTLLEKALEDDPPLQISDGSVIRSGWSKRLDELRELKNNTNVVLERYLESEREETGIGNLKVRYNRMLGYYLEVSKGNLDSVPDHFIRRRSLANGDRYTTDRLVALEVEINGVAASIAETEQDLFLSLKKEIALNLETLQSVARVLAEIDVFQSFAQGATVNGWVRPSFTDSGLMDIQDGRHPVVEAHVGQGDFIPNSITVNSDRSGISFAMITGPNMAGKSTFLRQTALISLMAQCGSFVPAQSAIITPLDRIFCRVGASDNLARGESTFLVEMTETAYILRSATKDSLVIMDEVGRGTSTEDGLSLARSITEFLLDTIGAKTLFATHYHELSRINHPRLKNFCLDVLETEGTVVFLKKVIEGASANSYGLHVARLAGIPEQVILRAKDILSSQSPASHVAIVPEKAHPSADISLFPEEDLVLNELLSVDVNTLTPFDALALIHRLQQRLQP